MACHSANFVSKFYFYIRGEDFDGTKKLGYHVSDGNGNIISGTDTSCIANTSYGFEEGHYYYYLSGELDGGYYTYLMFGMGQNEDYGYAKDGDVFYFTDKIVLNKGKGSFEIEKDLTGFNGLSINTGYTGSLTDSTNIPKVAIVLDIDHSMKALGDPQYFFYSCDGYQYIYFPKGFSLEYRVSTVGQIFGADWNKIIYTGYSEEEIIELRGDHYEESEAKYWHCGKTLDDFKKEMAARGINV